MFRFGRCSFRKTHCLFIYFIDVVVVDGRRRRRRRHQRHSKCMCFSTHPKYRQPFFAIAFAWARAPTRMFTNHVLFRLNALLCARRARGRHIDTSRYTSRKVIVRNGNLFFNMREHASVEKARTHHTTLDRRYIYTKTFCGSRNACNQLMACECSLPTIILHARLASPRLAGACLVTMPRCRCLFHALILSCLLLICRRFTACINAYRTPYLVCQCNGRSIIV